MTRKEAKDLLDNLIGFVEDNHGSDYDEALKMAIKALEQEPCEDAISRQAVLNTISELNAISFYEAQEDSKECYYEIRQAIEKLPSVTPQPKTGHWIYTGERSDWYDVTYKCSCCGKMIIVPYEARNEIYTAYPYCYCGAKMVAKSEEKVDNDNCSNHSSCYEYLRNPE